MTWLIAAGISIVLIAPAPFSWCPPAWIIYFLSKQPRASRSGSPPTSQELGLSIGHGSLAHTLGGEAKLGDEFSPV